VLDPNTIARYVHHSNRLDGIGLSEKQTRDVLARTVDATATLTGEDGKEYEAEVVLGHERALKAMLVLVEQGAPLTTEHIKALHKALMGELLLSAGEYRECALRYKGLLIQSPAEGLPERVQAYVDVFNAGMSKTTDAHKLSWRVHHEFITLHPFIEGNGRMARLLLNLVRLRKKLELTIVPFEQRDKYSKAIIEFQQQKIARAGGADVTASGGASGVSTRVPTPDQSARQPRPGT
jgi:Fic family protein